MWSFLFGQAKPKDQRELVRNCQALVKKEHWQLERRIQSIELEERKTKEMLKESARRGERAVCRLLAGEIVRARKAIARIYTTKAKLTSVEYQMEQQMATLNMSGSLEKSADIMRTMQELISVSDVTGSMRDLSNEMMKAGVMEEMVEDMFGDLEADEDLEEDAQKEVEKILWEMTAGDLEKAPAAIRDLLPKCPSQKPATKKEAAEDRDILARLATLNG